MKTNRNFLTCLFFGVTVCLLASCSGPVKYLASDICLVKKGETTRKEVTDVFGKPDRAESGETGTETWYYYNVQKSALSRIPYAGKKLCDTHLETAKIEFKGDVVSDYCYTLSKQNK